MRSKALRQVSVVVENSQIRLYITREFRVNSVARADFGIPFFPRALQPITALSAAP